jgi:hypothetical protein
MARVGAIGQGRGTRMSTASPTKAAHADLPKLFMTGFAIVHEVRLLAQAHDRETHPPLDRLSQYPDAMHAGRGQMNQAGVLVRRLLERAATDPPRWSVALGIFVFSIVAIDIWAQRGPLVGLVGLVTMGAVILLGMLFPRQATAWNRRHPIVSTPVNVTICGLFFFLGLAVCTRWSTPDCAFVGAALAALLGCFGAWRTRQSRR